MIMTREYSIIEILKSPTKSLATLFVFILLIGVVFYILNNSKVDKSQAVCHISYFVIMDTAGSPIGIPQYRLNQFVDTIDRNSSVNISMKLYHEKMTIVLKGESTFFFCQNLQ